MKTTSLGLKKPEGTDPVDIQDFNDNADTIDAELKKRPEKTGDASNMTVAFTEPASLAELTSNDSMKGLFGKLKLVTRNVISLARLMGTTDITDIGNGTVTGALSTLNNNFKCIKTFRQRLPYITSYYCMKDLVVQNGYLIFATLYTAENVPVDHITQIRCEHFSNTIIRVVALSDGEFITTSSVYVNILMIPDDYNI